MAFVTGVIVRGAVRRNALPHATQSSYTLPEIALQVKRRRLRAERRV
jgi:hypothetical protein